VRPDSRIERPVPAFLEEDSNGWLVTFSDLVLQLFAFVLVAAVLGTGSVGRDTSSALELPAARGVSSAPRAESLPERAMRPAADALTLARFDLPAPPPPRESESTRGVSSVEAGALHAESAVSIRPVPAPASVAIVEAAAAIPASPPAPSLATELESFVAEAGLGDAVHVSVNGGGVTLSISDTIGFASGSADLLPDAAPVLAEVRALVARRRDLVVEVSGHTDDRPLHAGPFGSNLDLSLARAARVAHELAAGNAELTERIFAAGYGAARPVAGNDDGDGRARNRRVEIQLLSGRGVAADDAIAAR
jgi:flagellar motor protein MotB